MAQPRSSRETPNASLLISNSSRNRPSSSCSPVRARSTPEWALNCIAPSRCSARRSIAARSCCNRSSRPICAPLMFPAEGAETEAAALLVQTRFTQPALFIIEYALAKLWMSWGIRPTAMIGHSVGEYVAGCLAGVFSLEDALTLVARRGALVQAQPGGAMLAVRLPEKEVAPLLNGQMAIAAINAPSLCVVSGPYDAITAFEKQLETQGVVTRHLHTSHAFHSPMMEPVLAPFTELLRKVKLGEPQIPYVSNVTARWITAAEARSAEYWASHVRDTVRFADGVAELMKDPRNVLLEVGPGQTLSTLARQHPSKAAGQIVLASLPLAGDEEPRGILEALGRLWMTGVEVDWRGFYAKEQRRRVVLPTYPFERKRYWPEPAASGAQPPATTTSPTTALPVVTTVPTIQAPAVTPDLQASAEAAIPRKERLLAEVAFPAAGTLRLRSFRSGSIHGSSGIGSGFSAADAGRDALSAQVRCPRHLPPIDGGTELVRRDCFASGRSIAAGGFRTCACPCPYPSSRSGNGTCCRWAAERGPRTTPAAATAAHEPAAPADGSATGRGHRVKRGSRTCGSARGCGAGTVDGAEARGQVSRSIQADGPKRRQCSLSGAEPRSGDVD